MSEDEELKALRQVADAVAFACIDLRTNLADAYSEYMSGKIPRGAYEYVLARQASVHLALFNAGYTAKHLLLEIPVKPGNGDTL